MSFLAITVTVGLLAGLALAVGYGLSLYNTLVHLASNCDKAWHNIDVLLQQRHDELMKLVDACKGYMQHESGLLTRITALRSGYDGAATVNDKVRLENELEDLFSQLRLSWENYPALRANENFMHLQGRVSALESSIADRRELYNDSINIHNIRIASLPDLLLARPLGYRRRDFLVVPEEARRDVKLEFAETTA